MIKLVSVEYVHSEKLSDKDKENYLIPEKYIGIIAIETWSTEHGLVEKAVIVTSVVDYILGFGDFKEVDL